MQIDEIINSFKSSHPAETVGDFKFGDIPVYATEEEGLPLPMPGEACIISKKHELELMNIIIRNGADSFSVIKNWFFHFRQRYGLDFQRKSWKGFDQDHELAISFLHQHGLNMNLSRFVSEEEEYNGKTKSFFIGLVLFILVFGSFIFWYSVFTDGFTNGISTSKKVDGITNFSAIICGIATFFLSLWGSFNNSSIVNLNYAPHIALLCVAIGFVLFFVNMFAQFFLSLILLFVVNI
jgi:hypothetical protein